MTALEERLRAELPQLADALLTSEGLSDPVPSDDMVHAVQPEPSSPPGSSCGAGIGAEHVVLEVVRLPGGRRHWWPVAATASVAVALVVGLGLTDGATDDSEMATDESASQITEAPGDDAEQEPPAGDDVGDRDVDSGPAVHGTWSVLPEAPIPARAHAVSAWTGEEAVFWAGTNLDRSFAHTDGAAYDPEAGSWRQLVVPEWGHPGLSGAFFDGELYALAKGGGSRIDPVAGVEADLPPVEGMYLAATVATDDSIWGLGPTGFTGGQADPTVTIARYEPATDSWTYGPTYEAGSDEAAIVQGLTTLDSSVHWTGTEIVVWEGTIGGLAFDPSTGTWRAIASPLRARQTVATTTGAGLTVLAGFDNPSGSTDVLVYVLDGLVWRWVTPFEQVSDTPSEELSAADFRTLTVTTFGSLTVTGSSDWLVVFEAERPPVTIHLPSQVWSRHNEGPLAGLQAPNTVWAGDSLLVWGGVSSDDEAPAGVKWTPAP